MILRKVPKETCIWRELYVQSYFCDRLEQPEKEIPADSCIRLHAAPFEIIPLRLKIKE